MEDCWLGLMIGNSRLHWSYFCNDELIKTWNTSQVSSLTELPQILDKQLKEYLLAIATQGSHLVSHTHSLQSSPPIDKKSIID